MTYKPEIIETHVRKCRVVIDKRTLERIVRDWAMQQVGFHEYATGAEIRFPDATEGSPPYKVGTYCTVDLTENQMMLTKEGTSHDD